MDIVRAMFELVSDSVFQEQHVDGDTSRIVRQMKPRQRKSLLCAGAGSADRAWSSCSVPSGYHKASVYTMSMTSKGKFLQYVAQLKKEKPATYSCV